MSKYIAPVLGGLALGAVLAWGDPGNGNAYGHDKQKDKEKKTVAVPEPSPWAEFAVCAVGLAMITRYITKAAKS